MKLKKLRTYLERKNKRLRARQALSARLDQLSANAVAALIQASGDRLLVSPEWAAIRRKVFAKYGRKCMKCGFVPKRGQSMNVDHIKPRCHYPELALGFDNLQVLCPACNQWKGNTYMIDYRPDAA